MKCLNCGALKLRTTETFQTDEKTIRTKKCRECSWIFTSHEVIVEDEKIPAAIRRKVAQKT